MEKRTTRCEKCGSEIEFALFSETLSQIVKCSSCSARVSYDPTKQKQADEEKERTADRPEESRDAKDLGDKEAAASRKTQDLKCPDCGKEFMVELPERKKETGKTICPRCSVKFSFDRADWVPEEPGPVVPPEEPTPPPRAQESGPAPAPEEMEYDEELPQPGDDLDLPKDDEPSDDGQDDEEPGKPAPGGPGWKAMEEGKQEVSCPECEFSFEVVLPKVKKREVLTLCPLCSHEFSFQRADYFFSDETDETRKRELPPPPSPPEEMEYGGEEHAAPGDEGASELFIARYIERSKGIALSFIDFDIHSIKESLLPANAKELARKKTGIAAMLLFIVFLLGMANAFSTLAFGLGQDADDEPGNKVTVAGTVYFGDDVVSGARVELVNRDEDIYHTSTEGKFWFYNVSSGGIIIEVTHEDYGKATVKFDLKDRKGELPQELDIILPAKGEETTTDLTSDSDDGMKIATLFFLTFLVFFLAALFALLGAISCLLSKNFKTAKYGAFIGILSWGFFIGSLFSLISVVLILLSKNQFEKKSFSDDESGEEFSEEEEEEEEKVEDIFL